jgi:hypothetical protein
MPDNGPYVIPLEEIEQLAECYETFGNYAMANWIRSQAQEFQIEWERELNGSNDEQ